jgi:hypothetical protein
MTSTPALTIPPVEDYLAKTATSAHALIVSIYNKLESDPSAGKTRAQATQILGCGMTSLRAKERLGLLQTWTDGTNVRVGTVSIYLHLLDLIVASHPVDGPARKARLPLKSFRKGYRRAASRAAQQEGREVSGAG